MGLNYRTLPDEVAERRANEDGWINLLTGLGVKNRDKTAHTTFNGNYKIGEQEATDLYNDDGFGRKVVDRTVNDMIREWFNINGDPEGRVLDEMKRLNFKCVVREALTWEMVYGGCITVIGANDGRKLDKPLNTDRLKRIEFMHNYNRYRVHWQHEDIYNDPNEGKYGKIEYYSITPLQGTQFRVHESRVLLWPGGLISDRTRWENHGWGNSEYQHLYERIRSLGAMYKGVENIVEDFVQAALTIKNLQTLIATGQEDIVKKRLDLLDLSRHVINTLLLDENEKYEKHSSTVSGLDDILDRFIQALSGTTDIPVIFLTGQSPKGLNATGESDIRQWYDQVKIKQESRLEPNVENITELIMLQREGPFRGTMIGGWAVDFLPLWQQSDEDKAKTHKTQAEADEIYIQTNVLSAEEVATSRFGGQEYSLDTTIDGERPNMDEPDDDEDNQE